MSHIISMKYRLCTQPANINDIIIIQQESERERESSRDVTIACPYL